MTTPQSDRLPELMLCLANLGVYSFTAWEQATGTRADLCWPMKRRPVRQELPVGPYLSDIYDTQADRGREHTRRVRVIEYTLDDGAAGADAEVGVWVPVPCSRTSRVWSRSRTASPCPGPV